MRNGADISLTDWQSDTTAEQDETALLSFEQAFAAHHRLIYRYAASLTRETGLAEDAVQEVFVRLYQNLEAAQRHGSLRAWLLRVTANVTRNLLRSRSRAQIRDESFVARQENIGSSPESDLMRQAEINEARRALAKLREPLRSCLLLRNEGLSYREISMALEINEANIGALLVRARREFARVFGKVGKS